MIRGTIQYQRSPEATAKAFREAMAAGNSASVEYWHERYEPLHFTVAGGRRYGYQKRKGDDEPPRVTVRDPVTGKARTRANPHYSWVKRRRLGHNRPLVFSGRSEQAAKQIRITASSTRGVGTFPFLPKYFYAYRKDLNQPDKAAELTTTVHDEVEQLAKVAQDAVVKQLESLRAPETVKA